MTTSRLNATDKEKIVKSMENMTRLVKEGHMKPTDALYETVKTGNFQPPMIDIMARAYNCGQSIYTRKTGESIFAKNANYELADSKVVIDKLLNSTDNLKKKAHYAPAELIKNKLGTEYVKKAEYEIDPVYNEKITYKSKFGSTRPNNTLHTTFRWNEPFDAKKEPIVTKEAQYAEQKTKEIKEKNEKLQRHNEIMSEVKIAAMQLEETRKKLASYLRRTDRLTDAEISLGCRELFDTNEQQCFKQASAAFFTPTNTLPTQDRTYSINEAPFNTINSLVKQAKDFFTLVKKGAGDFLNPLVDELKERVKDRSGDPAYIPDVKVVHDLNAARAKMNLADAIYNNPVSDPTRKNEIVSNYNKITGTIPSVVSTPIGTATLVNDLSGKEQISLGDLLDYIRAEKEYNSINLIAEELNDKDKGRKSR